MVCKGEIDESITGEGDGVFQDRDNTRGDFIRMGIISSKIFFLVITLNFPTWKVDIATSAFIILDEYTHVLN